MIPGYRRFPGGGNDTPLQYSCLGNPIDSGAWRVTVHGVAESDMTEHLSMYMSIFFFVHFHYSLLQSIEYCSYASTVGRPIYIPANSVGGFPFLHSLRAL